MFALFNKPLSKIYYWLGFITAIPALQTVASPVVYLVLPNLLLEVSFSSIVLGVFIFQSLLPIIGIFLLIKKNAWGLVFIGLGWLTFIFRNIAAIIQVTTGTLEPTVTTDVIIFSVVGILIAITMIGYIIWIYRRESTHATPVEAEIHQ